MNGVPLRRVNQAYVIATKTKVDIGQVDIPARLDDDYFRRTKTNTKSPTGGIFAESKQVFWLALYLCCFIVKFQLCRHTL